MGFKCFGALIFVGKDYFCGSCFFKKNIKLSFPGRIVLKHLGFLCLNHSSLSSRLQLLLNCLDHRVHYRSIFFSSDIVPNNYSISINQEFGGDGMLILEFIMRVLGIGIVCGEIDVIYCSNLSPFICDERKGGLVSFM